MEIELKTISTEDQTVYLKLVSYDQQEISMSLDLNEHEKINDLDLIDCAKIAYNNIQTHGFKFMCETAINLEGKYIYMGYWINDDIMEIHEILQLISGKLSLGHKNKFSKGKVTSKRTINWIKNVVNKFMPYR